jgi:hypothetical protein
MEAGTIKIKFVPRREGFRELLVSEGVVAEIRERAERVGAAARSAYPDIEILVEDRTGRRARYRVIANHPKAKRVEAKHRLLGNAMEAAR